MCISSRLLTKEQPSLSALGGHWWRHEGHPYISAMQIFLPCTGKVPCLSLCDDGSFSSLKGLVIHGAAVHNHIAELK